MKSLDKTAARIFHQLTDGLAPGGARYIDNTKGTFMRVAIDSLGGGLFAVAHRFLQNGDLCPDPDVEFFVADDGRVFPTAIEQMLGGYRRSVELGTDGKLASFQPNEQADLTSFCNRWMRNIADQQRLGPTGLEPTVDAAG